MALLACVYVLAAFLVADSVHATEFTPCKNAPAPVALRIKDCDTFPCLFHRGTFVEAEWDFDVTSDTDTLTAKATAHVFGAAVNYPLPQPDACKDITNGRCPVEEGELLTYKLRMEVLKAFPKLPLTVEFALVDEDGESQVCFKVDAKVVD